MNLRELRIDRGALFQQVGYKPHAGQRKVHASRASRRVLACGARFGKTLCAAMEAIASALEPREHTIGWVAAPTYDLADRVFSQIVTTVHEHLAHRVVAYKQSEHRILLRNLSGGISEIRCKSADNPVSLLGEGLDFVIVDEAAGLSPKIWNNFLSQRLLDKHGWALLISTPRGKGWFFEMWRRGQMGDPDYESWNLPSWANPRLDRALLEAQREVISEQAFRQEIAGEFIEGAGSVFHNVRDCATLSMAEPVAGQRYFAGLDLAKVEDWTVLTIVNKAREVVFADRFHRMDWSLQVNRIKAALERFNRARVLVDSTGAGEPIYETLLRSGCRADPYAFTAKSKAALIDYLSLSLEQRKVKILSAQVFPEGVEELESYQYSVSEQGNVRMSSPSGAHDDCVISLGLALWQWRSQPVGLQIGTINPNGRTVIRWRARG